jgi:endonuclease/exonuclease/phosphatase family metal-dependent hydrolase
MSLRSEDQGRGPSFTALTYNVHEWRGLDGRMDPRLAIHLVRQSGAGIVALQEVSFPTAGLGGLNLDHLARATGLRAIAGLTLCRANTDFGNALLTRFPVERVRRIDLSVRHREPRGAIEATLRVQGLPVTVLATHLGLAKSERRLQLRRLIGELDRLQHEFLLLMGDLNEWNPFNPSLRLLKSRFARTPSPGTYPSRIPLLSLDRILVRFKGARIRIRAIRSPLARKASDHLPLQATVKILRSAT